MRTWCGPDRRSPFPPVSLAYLPGRMDAGQRVRRLEQPVASDTPVAGDAGRRPDRLGAALAAGFIVLLLATELVLTLPDVADSASSVANFYAAHRSFIVILQALGLVAAGLFGAYAWRLRSVDRVVAAAGLLAAVCALVPGLITAVIALVADPVNPSAAARWNSFEPRGMTSCLSG